MTEITITGSVVDTDGQPWANARVEMRIEGESPAESPVVAVANGSGNISLSLWTNSEVPFVIIAKLPNGSLFTVPVDPAEPALNIGTLAAYASDQTQIENASPAGEPGEPGEVTLEAVVAALAEAPESEDPLTGSDEFYVAKPYGMLVQGAGTPAVNRFCRLIGSISGREAYAAEGAIDPEDDGIFYNGSAERWQIMQGTTLMYYSYDDGDTPGDCTTWLDAAGMEPVPTVTKQEAGLYAVPGLAVFGNIAAILDYINGES